MATIYKHFPGYGEARARVQRQSLEEDLKLIDNLFGRDELGYGATPEEVKAEALRQLEIDFRNGVDERATFFVMQHKILSKGNY